MALLSVGGGDFSSCVSGLGGKKKVIYDSPIEYDSSGQLTTEYHGNRERVYYDDPNGEKPYFFNPDVPGQKIYIDNRNHEDDRANVPTEVSGGFLTDASPIAQANGTRFSFDDVKQDQSPTCAFAATLSALARTDFNLPVGISLERQLGPKDFQFGVWLYSADGQTSWQHVEFDGSFYPWDLQSTDPNEYWPTLYQRGYYALEGIPFGAEDIGDAASVSEAFRALTGASTTFFSTAGNASGVASLMIADLNLGMPLVAVTQTSGPFVLDSSGMIHDHAYTVLGVDSDGAGHYFVTLRNPWGQDTDWNVYDANHDGSLSTAEQAARRFGLDGNDDGIIRIPWATFASDCPQVVVGLLTTGAPINRPLSPSPPTFNQPSNFNLPGGIATYTVTQVQSLSVDCSATAHDAGTLFYHLKVGDPGSIDQSGHYTLQGSSVAPGTYLVTVIAQTSPYSSNTKTFQITVTADVPRIGNFSSDKATISSSGNDLFKLTASNVVSDLGPIDAVEFWLDSNHSGQIEEAYDTPLAPIIYSSGNYTWSGAMALSPGTQVFLARAWQGANASLVKQVSLQVDAAGVTAPLVTKDGAETLASPTAAGVEDEPIVAYDETGNGSVFYHDTDTGQIYLQRYDASGAAIGSRTHLTDRPATHLYDVAMLADGHFLAVWGVTATDIRATEYNADGSDYGSVAYYEVPTTGPRNFEVRAAIAAPGEFTVVIRYGGLGSPTSHYYRYSNGALAADQTLDGGNLVSGVTVAMDSRGVSLVAWIDLNSGQAMAQRFDVSGAPVGSASLLNAAPNSVETNWSGKNNIGVALDETGRTVFVWTEYNSQTGYDDVYARRFLADGTAVDAREFRVNDSLAGGGTRPVVSFHASRFVISWTRGAIPNYDTVLGQAFSWENTLRQLGGNVTPSTVTQIEQFLPSVAVDYQGKDFLVAWVDSTTGSTHPNNDVYFQRFNKLDATADGFGLQAAPPQTSSLRTVPALPPDLVPLGAFVGESGRTWDFQKVSGDGDTDNTFFTIANGLLFSVPNYIDLRSHYSIRVRATPDDGGLPIEQVFDFSPVTSYADNFGQLLATDDIANAAIMQPEGRLIVVGDITGSINRFGLARYLSDGTLDPAFGGGTGRVVTSFGPGTAVAHAAALQADGKIIVAGHASNGANDDFALARYKPDGSLDTTFGVNGRVTTDFGVGHDGAFAVAIQTDGKIVVVGYADQLSTNNDFALARYNADGSLDSTFGVGGRVVTAFGSSRDIARAVALQSDGGIVVAGYSYNGSNYDFAVARYRANGGLDTTFNGTGKVITTVGSGDDIATAVAVQWDGKIVAAGSTHNGSYNDVAVVRYNSGGTLDTSFDSDGIRTINATGHDNSAVSVAMEPDHAILVGGTAFNGTDNDFLYIRFSPDGGLSTMVRKNLGGNEVASSVAFSPDAEPYVVGSTNRNGHYDFAAWKDFPLFTPPTTSISGPTAAVTGQSLTFTFGALSASLRDQAAGFIYRIAWGDGPSVQTASGPDGLQLTHVYDAPGTYTIDMRAIDQHGLSSDAFFTITITGPQLFEAAYYPTGILQPSSLAVGDFNGDGKPDVAAASWPDGKVSAFLNNTLGGLHAPTTFSPIDSITAIASGDLDGDDNLDLMFASGNQNLVVGRRGNGDGTFPSWLGGDGGHALAYPVGSGPQALVLADVNRDGKLDVAVANADNTVSVLLNNGDGTFAAAINIVAGNNPNAIAAGDLNGDGKTDLVIANHGNSDGSNISVLLGNGNGTYQAPLDFATGAGLAPESLALADFNGDGKLDVAVGNLRQSVSVLFGNGDGTLGSFTSYIATSFDHKVAAGDFDGDGKPDLIVSNYVNNSVSVLINRGDGTFAAQSDFDLGVDSGPAAVATADFNGDGRADIAVAGFNGNVTLLNYDRTPRVIGIAPPLMPGVLPVGTNSLQVNFSDPVVSADQNGSFDLRSAGADGLFDTNDDKIIALIANASRATATLTFAGLPKGIYRLTVKDVISSVGGKHLDGDEDGAPTGNWVHQFEVRGLHYSTAILADAPVAYWRLGEASGASAADATGNNRTGTYVPTLTLGSAGAIADTSDTAAAFIGGHVDVPSSTSLAITGPFTLEAWIITATPAATQGILEKYDRPAFNGYVLRLDGGVITAFTVGPSAFAQVTGTTQIQANTWYHVAAVYDGAHLSVYVNGVLDGTTSTTINPGAGTTSLKIGAFGDIAINPFNGRIDEAAVYAKALSADTLQNHYRLGINLSPTANAGGSYSQEIGSNVVLDGSASSDPNGATGDSIVNYEWDLNNDGTYDISTSSPTSMVSWATMSGIHPAIGPYTIGLRVTDTFGVTATTTAPLNVQDTTAPTLSGTPSNTIVKATGPSGAVVTYTLPTASDLADGPVNVITDHPSGTVFALGVTTVHFSATDQAGNTSTSSFTITVEATAVSQAEDTATPARVKVGSLPSSDSTVFRHGIAVTGLAGRGTWQYSADGQNWSNMGAVSAAQAKLLLNSYLIRFVSAKDWNGQATLVYRTWNGTGGTVGQTVTITATGPGSHFSAQTAVLAMQVAPVNDAPIWTRASVGLPRVVPGLAPAGNMVANIFAASFKDIDADPVGMAVTGMNAAGKGTWQYSTNGGTIWNSIGPVSAQSALLLSGDALIRFLANAHVAAGAVSLQVRAWDGKQGSASHGSTRATFNLNGSGTTGGTTAFSTALLTVNDFVNTAPTLASSTGPILPSTQRNVTSKTVPVTSLLGRASDPDTGALRGIAIVGASGPGTWQYSLDGTTWLALGNVSNTSARLLPSTAKLRFLPAKNQTGTATLTYRAWDQTSGKAGGLFNIGLGTGIGSAFSAVQPSATLNIV